VWPGWVSWQTTTIEDFCTCASLQRLQHVMCVLGVTVCCADLLPMCACALVPEREWKKKSARKKKKCFFGKCGITTASGREGTDGGICQLCVTNSTTTQLHGRIGVGRLPTVVGLKFVAWSWCGLWGSQQLQKHGWIGVGRKFTLTCTVRGLLRVECRGSPVCSRRL
jgi:hypothetical protein